MKIWLALLALALPTGSAAARPVLLELFTSQSCSSCPPAEALLGALKASGLEVNVLEFHVDYWNALNWRDPFSSRAATSRQRGYAQALGSEVFTPQLVVDGRRSAIGSDRPAVLAAIDVARAAQAAGPALAVTGAGSQLRIEAGAGSGDATLVLVGYDASHETPIPSGENAGALLKEVNLVRSVQAIGAWHGQAAALTVNRPAGEHAAILLQAADGTILAQAFP